MSSSLAECKPYTVAQVHPGDRVCLLSIREPVGLQRHQEPICLGIPFPQGLVSDLTNVALFNAKGEQLPLQTRPLSTWIDGSVRWMLADFLVNADPFQNQDYYLRVIKKRKSPLGNFLVVKQYDDEVTIDTGRVSFRVPQKGANPLFWVTVEKKFDKELKGPSLVLIDEHGEASEFIISTMHVESQGPIRATIALDGTFQKDSQTLARFFSRVSFFAGSGFVEIQSTLHNPKAAQHPGGLWDLGDKGSLVFQDLSMEIPFDGKTIEWNLDHSFEYFECSSNETLEIYQDSSGGRNWQSTNHCNRNGKIVPAFPGYRVKKNGEVVGEGQRAIPTLSVAGEEGRWDAAMEKFWQNFPKAIEVQPNGFTLRLFPRQCQDLYELQGGEQKTHTIFFQISSTHDRKEPLTWVHERLVPRLSAEWYAHSGVIPYLTPRSLDPHQDYLELIDSAINGEKTFFDRREIIDEYGWRNFGDVYGDHEAVGHTGPTPKVSHYNNQYDVINGALIEFYRSGDFRWYDLMRDLARHVIDIDLYHTTEDRPEYNGGMFWHTDHYFDAATASHRAYSKANANPENPSLYGGGPSNEQNYTTGLLHYYYLTGDPLAFDAVLELANWVLRMDEGGRHWLRVLDPRPTGLASSSAGRNYHGPGRGAGNSINALLDAYRLFSNREYIEKAEELIRRCIHPHDVIELRNLEDVEYRWSYTVFLQVLGKYLDFKIEYQEIDTMYAYAQASLIHYAKWMLKHEVPYQQVMDKVKIPTETWPAQDIRKCNVFLFAAKHTERDLRNAFLQKAGFFFHACVKDLLSYATSHLTRPIVLLLVNGYMRASFVSNPEQQGVILKEYPDFGMPKSFTPQLAEVYKLKELVDHYRGMIQSWLSGHRP